LNRKIRFCPNGTPSHLRSPTRCWR
jgi:hypothetical protein